jgi:predicted SAM-dependent methyltransferase
MFYQEFKNRLKEKLPRTTVNLLRISRRRVRHLTLGSITWLKCRSRSGVWLNVGCGATPITGWINLDILPHIGVMCWDCTKGLPFKDGAIEAIYSEHFFEHLDFESEAKMFLRECLRCLRPNGILRIAVPDGEKYLRFYAQNDWFRLAAMRPLVKDGNNYRELYWWPNKVYKTKMELINFAFRQDGEHKFMYDAETLVLMLRESGFSSSYETDYNESHDPKLNIDSLWRKDESIYVEAIK